MIYKEIAELIHKHIFQVLVRNQLNVFLIGSEQGTRNSLRDPLRKELLDVLYYPSLEVFYPEELFDELFQGRNQIDLLRLENLLAKSVHAIVIVLESPGAIAELGAFANHEELKKRLIVIVDQKYKKDKSFIMLGPVKMLKKTNGAVIYYDFEDRNNESLKKLGEQTRGDIRRIAKQVTPDNTIKNLINAQFFLLAAVYVMQPIGWLEINEMIKAIGGEDEEIVLAIANSSLNILLRNKELVLLSGKYELTKEGLKRITDLLRHRWPSNIILDKLRVVVLNNTLRKNRRWGAQVLSSADARLLQLVDGVNRHP